MRVLRFIAPLLLVVASAVAQTPRVHRLSLEDALQRAIDSSESVAIARAGVSRAEGNRRIAVSQFLPQINASVSYTRTLMSQYSGILPSGSQTSSSNDSSADSSGGSSGLGSIFKNLSFGQENIWSVGVTLSQPIFAGGRLTAQKDAADARHSSAEIDVTSAGAQAMLDVVQGYYDAVLADQLLKIADSSLAQTEEIFRQTDLAYRLGSKSEFEMLRARVARDNQLPVLMQRQSDRALAYDYLKQLLNLPLDDSLALSSGVEEQAAIFTQPSDTSVDERAPVRQAELNVRASSAQVDMARGERWPTVALTSRFAPVAYPDGIFPSISDFRTDWTVGVNVSVPLFTGGRIGGEELVAQGTLDESQARLRQARQAAALDARTSMRTLDQAAATLSAITGTVDQATRAYQIAQIRFREGIATQLDLADARLQVEQALTNRARALRNVQVARTRLALLRDLPLSQGGPAVSMGAAAMEGAAQGASGRSQSQGASGLSQSQGAASGGAAADNPVTGGP